MIYPDVYETRVCREGWTLGGTECDGDIGPDAQLTALLTGYNGYEQMCKRFSILHIVVLYMKYNVQLKQATAIELTIFWA